MKFIYLCLALVMVFCMIFSTGCVPVVPEEPEEPMPILSAEVIVLGSNPCGDHHHVYYTVENTGNVDVNYELKFVVDFDGHQPRTFIVESDEYLEVGIITGVKDLLIQCENCNNLGAHDVVSIDVTYELWE